MLFILILRLAEPARAAETGRGLPDLTVDALASCLDRSDEMAALDGEINEARAQMVAVRRAMNELSLRLRTLAPTARVDAALAVETAALKIEYRAAYDRLQALREGVAERLELHRIIARGHETLCAGRSYSDADLVKAEALRRAR